MKTLAQVNSSHVDVGLSPMCISCPIAGSRILIPLCYTTVIVTRP